MHTACVWSEKLPFAGYSVVKDPPAPFGFGEDAPCDASNLVENTGLEPVTSWLQTRRSPS